MAEPSRSDSAPQVDGSEHDTPWAGQAWQVSAIFMTTSAALHPSTLRSAISEEVPSGLLSHGLLKL